MHVTSPWDRDWHARLVSAVEKMGSVRALARHIGACHQTVHDWITNRTIPQKYAVLQKLRSVDVRVPPRIVNDETPMWAQVLLDWAIDHGLSITTLARCADCSYSSMLAAMDGRGPLPDRVMDRIKELTGIEIQALGYEPPARERENGWGSRIKKARMDLGLTRSQLGLSVSIASSTIRAFEMSPVPAGSLEKRELLGRELGLDLIENWGLLTPGKKLRWYRTFHMKTNATRLCERIQISQNVLTAAEGVSRRTAVDSREFWTVCERIGLDPEGLMTHSDIRIDLSPYA